jgi:large subunit ribosomal protein L27
MAKTKGAGGSKKGKDKLPKYLGIKIPAGAKAEAGNIIVRQRGTIFVAGKNVRQGKDDTLYAIKPGKVSFVEKKKIGFNSVRKTIKTVNVD